MTPDNEETRIDRAAAAMPDLLADWQPGITVDATHEGRRLWQVQRAAVQAGQGDDRPLYWQRLVTRLGIRRAGGEDMADRIAAFERSSRGLEDIVFSDAADYRVLVTGFDPFRLDDHIEQSNPSGYLALLLDETLLPAGTGIASIQGCMMPVRYPDFDQGLIESTLQAVTDRYDLDMLITVSMGRSGFDLERFPGRRRSAPGPDNLNLMSGGSELEPLVPPGLDESPEFVEFSLPVEAMLKVPGEYEVHDNHGIATLESGSLSPASLDEVAGETCVRGSGGGYLSNEISYRAILWRNRQGFDFPVGHIHTPRMAGSDRDTLQKISVQLQALVRAAVEVLDDKTAA